LLLGVSRSQCLLLLQPGGSQASACSSSAINLHTLLLLRPLLLPLLASC
jgi:hypothetical protein